MREKCRNKVFVLPETRSSRGHCHQIFQRSWSVESSRNISDHVSDGGGWKGSFKMRQSKSLNSRYVSLLGKTQRISYLTCWSRANLQTLRIKEEFLNQRRVLGFQRNVRLNNTVVSADFTAPFLLNYWRNVIYFFSPRRLTCFKYPSSPPFLCLSLTEEDEVLLITKRGENSHKSGVIKGELGPREESWGIKSQSVWTTCRFVLQAPGVCFSVRTILQLLFVLWGSDRKHIFLRGSLFSKKGCQHIIKRTFPLNVTIN